MADAAAQRRGRDLPTVERRSFLRVGLFLGTAGGLGAFGAGVLGFLWPRLGEGFGATVNMSSALGASPEEIVEEINSTRAPVAYPAGRLYLVTWDPAVPGAQEQYGEEHARLDGGAGLMALYQKCVHLGCRVPWCQSSQWFECPCHGSKYNKWGEWVSGPAPRGLDRFPSEIDDNGDLLVNTGVIVTGPARTARVLQQQQEGPNCVDI